jgi:hypothetical protein
MSIIIVATVIRSFSLQQQWPQLQTVPLKHPLLPDQPLPLPPLHLGSAAAASAPVASPAAARQSANDIAIKFEAHWRSNYNSDCSNIHLAATDEQMVPVDTKNKEQKTKLITICGRAIAVINKKALQKFCTVTGIPGWSSKMKYEMAQLVVAFATNQG